MPSHCGIRERTQQREQHCERALLAAAFANWNHADTTDASLRKVLRERRAALPPDHDFEAFRQQRITLDSALFACGVLLSVRLRMQEKTNAISCPNVGTTSATTGDQRAKPKTQQFVHRNIYIYIPVDVSMGLADGEASVTW